MYVFLGTILEIPPQAVERQCGADSRTRDGFGIRFPGAIRSSGPKRTWCGEAPPRRVWRAHNGFVGALPCMILDPPPEPRSGVFSKTSCCLSRPFESRAIVTEIDLHASALTKIATH